jgi:hypothetical protein
MLPNRRSDTDEETDSTMATVNDVETAGPAGAAGPVAAPLTLSVNGDAHQLVLEPRVSLLDAYASTST